MKVGKNKARGDRRMARSGGTGSRRDSASDARAPAGPDARAPAALWLYGTHAVLAALANQARRCRRLLLTRDSRRALGERIETAWAAGDHGAQAPPFEIVARAKIDALLPPGVVHQGLALQTEPLPADMPVWLTAEPAPRDAVLVVLDRVSDPRNLGAVLRAAAAFGARGVIVPDRHAPAASGTVAKAASGALEEIPLFRVANISRTLEALKARGFWCVGLDGAAEQSLATAALSGRVALVLGAEGAGLRRLTRARCDLLVRIPIHGRMVDSLNLSTAAAVALYEIAGRR